MYSYSDTFLTTASPRPINVNAKHVVMFIIGDSQLCKAKHTYIYIYTHILLIIIMIIIIITTTTIISCLCLDGSDCWRDALIFDDDAAQAG